MILLCFSLYNSMQGLLICIITMMYELLFLDRRSFRDILSYVYVVNYISTFLIVCLFAFFVSFFFVYFFFLFVHKILKYTSLNTGDIHG
jgi:hypothetical protein